MKLELKRQEFTDNSTIGELTVEGVHQCFTLEDMVRPEKIKGKTAIPAGTYEVAVTFSSRFQKPLPLLFNVPDFEGVRIHPGNTAADTEGCILVGKSRAKDSIGESRAAFTPLFEKIQAALQTEKVFIEITEER